MHRIVLLGVTIGLLLGTGSMAGCGGSSPTVPTPTAVLSTEVFTGTIAPLGTASHPFTVNYAAAYSDASITVTALATVGNGTPQSITIGVGFGTTNLGVCTRAAGYSNVAAPLNTELPTSGTPFIAGLFCVQLFDNPAVPTVTEALSYSITIKHY